MEHFEKRRGIAAESDTDKGFRFINDFKTQVCDLDLVPDAESKRKK